MGLTVFRSSPYFVFLRLWRCCVLFQNTVCRKCAHKYFITIRKCVKIRTLAFKNIGRKCVKILQKVFAIQKFLLPLQPIN